MPFPSSQVLHDKWAGHNAEPATGAMTAVVALVDPGAAGTRTINDTTGQTTVTPALPAWSGPARVQARSDLQDAQDVVAQDVTTPPYLIALPLGDTDHLPIRLGWRLTVQECTDDPTLVGRTFVIRNVLRSTQRLQRDLICDGESETR